MPIREGIRYRPSPYQLPLFQGDVISDVSVLTLPSNQARWILLRASTDSGLSIADILSGKRPRVFLPRSEEGVADAWTLGAEAVVAKATRTPVILVTQTCDLDWRKHYQVAPIKRLADLNADKQNSLRSDEIGYLYYLKARPPEFPDESYADLTQMTSVHRSYFRAPRILCRFTNRERSHFQRAISGFHGSPFGFTTADEIHEPGRYACVSCFHHGHLRTVDLGIGGRYPACACNEPLWILIGG